MIGTPFLDARSVTQHLDLPARGPSLPIGLGAIAREPYFNWLEIIIGRSRHGDGAYKEPSKRARFKPHRAPNLVEIKGHFTGGMRKVGTYLMRIGSTTTLLWVIDLDDHDGTLGWDELCRRADAVTAPLVKQGLCPARFRSSGGKGIHLWGYWDEPQDGYSVRQLLKGCVQAAGLPVKSGVAEVFPAQDRIEQGACGNPVFWPIERLDGGEWRPSALVPVVEPPERASSGGAFTGDVALLRDATMAIPNGGDSDEEQPYGEGEFGYLKVGMALHDATGGGDEGLEIWREWAAQSSRYTGAGIDRRWRSFKVGGGITARSLFAEARKHGWEEPADLDRMFADEPEAEGGAGAGEQRELPQARHLCTDQANADRLLKAAGTQVMVAAGRWYFWTGTHWTADEDAAYRLACGLSALIHAEADDWERRPASSAEEKQSNRKTAESLRGWAKQSEMKHRIDAAFNLLRRLVATPFAALDSDPYLLNAANGTIDLRTGDLRPHDPADRITKVIAAEHRPDARAPGFEKALAEVTGEVHLAKKPVAEFMQRWFGYCATGLVSEDALAFHHGDGGNGKTLIMGLIAWVLGPYATTAAPDLLVGGRQQSHPTGTADLAGRRMVTAFESSEGGTLNEDFVKRATGRDKMKARFMRGDFFEFSPTHKLQLVTNHKPQIRGQDAGIWRRVLLIPYGVRFGRPEEVEAGEAHFVRDEGLEERLKAEASGILNWIVRGALAWRDGGLQPPDSVLAAGRSYREEQDRVGQFIAECCERNPEGWAPLRGRDGLHPAYQAWSRENGYHPLGRAKFQEALEKRPGITKDTRRFPPKYSGVVGYTGLVLLPADVEKAEIEW